MPLMRVLVPNLGSTSLKYQLLETENETVLARGKIDRIGGAESQIICWETGSAQEWRSTAQVPDHRAAIKILVDRLAGLGTGAGAGGGIAAVGFKAVHGGPRYCGSFLVDDDLLAAMQDFVPVAPVHNPVYIQAMQIFREILPGVPMVAVFETGFHATIPEHASTYGVPYEWREKYGVRRYGFHGSSHRYISQRVPELLCRPVKGLRLISCHLGGSSSVTAIHSGQSVDTSLGFSPIGAGAILAFRRPGPVCGPARYGEGKLTRRRSGNCCARRADCWASPGSAMTFEIWKKREEGNSRAALALECLSMK